MGRPRKAGRHLPPCVYEKHGAFWLVKKGKWERIGDTLPEALEAYARRHEAKHGGQMPALIRRVLEHVSPRLAASTVEQYTAAADRLCETFAEFNPDTVQPRHVAQLKTSMVATPNMANRVLSFLRVVFNYAVEWQLVDSNPVIGIMRYDEAKRKRCPTDEELARVHAAAGPRLKVIIELHVLTGQRVNDVLSIRRDQILPEGIRFKQKKTGKELTIAWNPELRATYQRALALSGDVPALTLLKGRYGGALDYTSVALQWREACERAGLQDLQMRDLRAKAVTTAKRQGLDPQAVAGHASSGMTARYIREHEIPVVQGPSFRQLLDN